MAEAPFWRDRRVLVTGATGILGSWLVDECLRRGASVVALIRDGLNSAQEQFNRGPRR